MDKVKLDEMFMFKKIDTDSDRVTEKCFKVASTFRDMAIYVDNLMPDMIGDKENPDLTVLLNSLRDCCRKVISGIRGKRVMEAPGLIGEGEEDEKIEVETSLAGDQVSGD